MALSAGNFANSLRTLDPTVLGIMVRTRAVGLLYCVGVPSLIRHVQKQVECAARAYYMTMLFNLNFRNKGGMVMQGPSTLSHLSSQLRTQPSVQLSQTGSAGSTQKQTIVHVLPEMVDEIDEVHLPLTLIQTVHR